MLFGEYGVIHGSPALALPLKKFYGEFAKGTSDYDLSNFWEYLKSLTFSHASFNQTRFEQDLREQKVFKTNIAIGYGLGSSGAFCAAVFDRYFDRPHRIQILELKKMLARIESFFHGESSGLDPLVSYLQTGILKHPNQDLELIAKPSEKWNFYLVDTGMARSTEKWVKLYLEKYKEKNYQNQISKLIDLNKQSIEHYLRDSNSLYNTFAQISVLEQEIFKEMIPPSFEKTYSNLQLKLCGAGGGGYFLGLCQDGEIPMLKDYAVLRVD